MASFDVGDVAILRKPFYNEAGSLADPTAVTLEVGPRGATKTTYTYGTDVELVKEGVGLYRCDVVLAVAGTWRFRWFGSGVNQDAETGSFDVAVNPFV